MNRHRPFTARAAGAWLAGLWLILGATACEPFRGNPETRARDFIEALVTSPAEIRLLRDIANLSPEQDPGALINDLSARVGLDYLRARLAQGVPLQFAAGERRLAGDSARAVVILVTCPEPGTPATGEVRFLVRSNRDDQGRWRIARVTGDN